MWAETRLRSFLNADDIINYPAEMAYHIPYGKRTHIYSQDNYA